jgi:FkbM family methyltransferase
MGGASRVASGRFERGDYSRRTRDAREEFLRFAGRSPLARTRKKVAPGDGADGLGEASSLDFNVDDTGNPPIESASESPPGRRTGLDMKLEDYERLAPCRTVAFQGRDMTFFTPNGRTLWRVESLLSKEPDTIEWIGGFAAGDTLLDIGANVGMYSIFAARTRGARVFAFEPESQNYAILNRNIHLNGLSDLVSAYCAALSDRPGFSQLHLSLFDSGGSCHSYGAPLDHNNQPVAGRFTQGCIATTVDDLVAAGAIPVPAHVKIDVDGLEHKVIAGAKTTLADRDVRSVLIEINTALDEHWEVVDAMLALGFDYGRDQVARSVRTEGTFQGVGNYVFRR